MDAEFQNSPHSPYAQSCATESVTDFVLSRDSEEPIDELNYEIEALNHCHNIISGNNSLPFVKELSGEPPSAMSRNENVQCDSIVSDNRDGVVCVHGEAHNCKDFTGFATTTDDDSGKTDKKGFAAATGAAGPVSSGLIASPPLRRHRPKKPMVDRLQSAVGKMLAYMRPPKHSRDEDDDNNGHRHATVTDTATIKDF